MLIGQDGLFGGVHAADARAIGLVVHVPRAHALYERDHSWHLAIGWPLEMSPRGTRGTDQPLVLETGNDVVDPAVTVLLQRTRIERIETGGQYYRSYLQLDQFFLLLEVYGPCLAGLLTDATPALGQIQARLGVDGHLAGDRLGKRQVCRLPLCQPHVEFVRYTTRALLGTVAATRALLYIHIAGFPAHSNPEVASRAVQFHYVAVGEKVYAVMASALDHLGRQDTHRAIVGREGLVQLGHATTNAGSLLHKVDLKAHVGQVNRSLDTGYPATDDQDRLVLQPPPSTSCLSTSDEGTPCQRNTTRSMPSPDRRHDMPT